MADTPTGESKAAAAGSERPNSDPDRRSRTRKGKGKGKGEGDRRERKGPHAGKGRDGRGGRNRDNHGRDDRGRRDRSSEQPLTAGLFAGVADREMPCRIAGCTKTWTWYGTQQIRSLGKPEPKRMCSEHLAQFEGIEDRAMPCRNSWCTNTWMWSRGAQLYQRERQDKLKPPHRLCEQCFEEDKTTEDVQIECKIPECRNSWTWPRQAQLRHRAWVRRQQAKIEAEDAEELRENEAASAPPVIEAQVDAGQAQADAGDAQADAGDAQAQPGEAQAGEAQAQADAGDAPADAGEAAAETPTDEVSADEASAKTGTPGKKRRRKRRRRRKIHDGPPEKLCERCFERVGHLEPIDIPCKVHGCTNMWSWEREGQLRAWAALDAREEVTELPQPPRRMCNSCFEFVRARGDREVACGRPGCQKTWTYRTGAQLQDFLAGRTRDPIRLCEECSRSQFVIRSSQGMQMPAGAEVMPCQVSGCAGSWVYAPGMRLSSADPDAAEPPIDRMCDDCRGQRGAPTRDPRHMRADPEPESTPSEVAREMPAASDEPGAEEAPAADPSAADPSSDPSSDPGAPSEDPTPS